MTKEIIEQWKDHAKKVLAQIQRVGDRNDIKTTLLAIDKDQRRIIALCDEVEKLKREVNGANENNRKRNLQLDALNFVWCSGGCDAGLHRWAEGKSIEEIDDLLGEAERNTSRLKSWVENYKARRR